MHRQGAITTSDVIKRQSASHPRYSATLVLLILFGCTARAFADDAPWAPHSGCRPTNRGVSKLIPEAQIALKKLKLDHRVSQSLNTDRTDPRNYHWADSKIEGQEVSAAVDLSVECGSTKSAKQPLDPNEIKQLLSALTDAGFVAWYRKNGQDGWIGGDHVHAVYAKEPLKPQLQRQIASWLEGRTGLKNNAPYSFWSPTDSQKLAVRTAYEASKKR